MDILEVMRQRHSVRNYTDKELPDDVRKQLTDKVEELNKESGLHMQLFFDEPSCFATGMAHYGKFSGVKNYLSIVGKKSSDLEEKSGYYGEQMVLFMQSIGLNSCWVAMTHGKSKAVIGDREKEAIIISLGYGATQGVPHKGKALSALCDVKGEAPDWFKRGMEAVSLSPTAVNQQKFIISYDGNKLTAKVKGMGFYTKIDLGIVKYDFELASGHRFDE